MSNSTKILTQAATGAAKKAGKAFPAKVPPQAAVEGLSMLLTAFNDYKKTVEIERTKRSQIAAWRDTEIERIRSQREALESYLREVFKERKKLIEELFERMDRGIESGDDHLVSGCLSSIISVAKDSPLRGAYEMMQKMSDPNVKIIDI